MLQTQVRSLSAVRDALLALPHPFTRESVESTVRDLQPSREELAPYLNFSTAEYTRTLFYRGPRFEVLVLCWKDGQCSPVHDHAASICSMAVVKGSCTTDNYRIAGGRAACGVMPGETVKLEKTSRETCPEGRVVTVIGGDIHQVGNLQGNGADLITVHFYLPAIPSMRCFDPETGVCSIRQASSLSPRR